MTGNCRTSSFLAKKSRVTLYSADVACQSDSMSTPLNPELDHVESEDTAVATCRPGTTAEEVVRGFFTSAPPMMKALMGLRNVLVKLFGLKTGAGSPPLDSSPIVAGRKIGLFEIAEIDEHHVVMGTDDKHLDFRVRITIEDTVVTCRTQVKFNNSTGRFYFRAIQPFHHVIVPKILQASVVKDTRVNAREGAAAPVAGANTAETQQAADSSEKPGN